MHACTHGPNWVVTAEKTDPHTWGAQIFRGVAKSKQKITMQCGVATSQGMLVATRSWKTQGTDCALKFLMGAQPCQHLDFGLCLCAKSLQLYPTLWDPADYSPPGSSVHGSLQARILEWVAISFSRGCCQLRARAHVSRDTDFRCLASISAREYISFILSHQACGNLLHLIVLYCQFWNHVARNPFLCMALG